jgi:hypothetical protein
MKCPHKECVRHEDCGIIDIIKKTPKNPQSCSYFTDSKRQQKINNKLTVVIDDLSKKKLRKTN